MSIQKLKETGKSLSNLFDLSKAWMKDNDKLTSAKKQRMDGAHRNVRKMIKALDKKPVFALYGASQVGKSYLAHIILSGDQQELMVNLGSEQVNFLERINPPGGGAEATGVVTRFTINPVSDSSYPVMVRLMGFEDVCLVLCKAFYQNFKESSPLTESAVKDHLSQLRASIPEANHPPLASTDAQYWVQDVQNSLQKYFPGNQSYWDILANAGLWAFCEENLNKLLTQPQTLAQALGPLWMNQTGLTEIATSLFTALKEVNWEETGYLQAEAVLREEYGGHAIVDVMTLRQHLGNDQVQLTMQCGAGISSVNRAVISALTKEIVLSVVQNDLPEEHYLQRADIMDFPGARSPIAAEGLEIAALPFLRGKVGHLFDQYSRDFEINNLLFCIPDKQNDVTDLPQILKEWIDLNVGPTPELREQLIRVRESNPLMVIFTWFNRQLCFDKTNDTGETLHQKWTKRFGTFFETEMVNDHTWANEWTPGKSFQNVHPLRDYSFESVYAGYELTGSENGLADLPDNESFTGTEEFLTQMKASFVAHDACRKYLADTEATWESCATLNQDGSAPIIAAMEKASQISGLATHARSVLTAAIDGLLEELELHFHSDDIAERHREAEQLKAGLKLFLNRSMHPRSRFDLVELQRTLTIESEDIFDWLENQSFGPPAGDGQAREMFFMTHPDLHSDMSGTEIVDWFMREYQCPDEATAIDMAWTNFQVNLRKLNEPETSANDNPLIGQAIEHFGNTILKFDEERHHVLIRAGLDEDLIQRFLAELELGMETRKLSGRISEHLAGRPDVLTMGQVDTHKLSELIAHAWNEFLFHANESYYEEADLVNIRFTPRTKPSTPKAAFDAVTQMFKRDKQMSLPEVHMKPGVNTCQAWMERLHNLFTVNCGFANYDMEENARLGDCIQQVKRAKKTLMK